MVLRMTISIVVVEKEKPFAVEKVAMQFHLFYPISFNKTKSKLQKGCT